MPQSITDVKKYITPRLAITLGDPAGIGPSVTLKSLVSIYSKSSYRIKSPGFILIGTLPDHLQHTNYYQTFQSMLRKGVVEFVDVAGGVKRHNFPVGKPSSLSGKLSFLAIKKSVDMAIKNEVDGIVTAPVSKVSLELSGLVSSFQKEGVGHTEILKKLTHSKRVQMVMCIKRKEKDIRVILVTRHLPLSKVSQELTISKIVSVVLDYVSIFGAQTRFVACALNPHAGDQGLLGDEEKRIISPAIRRLKDKGFHIDGPFPADSVFANLNEKKIYDCVIAMYHDQAMIPLKVIEKKSIVNLTIGLPFIRTSPGHGVGYDIVNRPSLIDEKPMTEAIKFAMENWILWKK